jgi:hypothetical protein
VKKKSSSKCQFMISSSKSSLLILLLFIVFLFSISSASLIYDKATGNLDGFRISDLAVPNKSNPDDYKNSNEYWNNEGYLGRLVYSGPPTTFSFVANPPYAIGTTNNRFYFTLNNQNPEPQYWREFFSNPC